MSNKRKKIAIDAVNQAPGRLATKIAGLLMGKGKVTYVPYLDMGDKVMVTGVSLMKFSGKKLDKKIYRHHSNYPGGLKEIPARKIMKEAPEKILLSAVEKMLPKNKMRTARLKRITFK